MFSRLIEVPAGNKLLVGPTTQIITSIQRAAVSSPTIVSHHTPPFPYPPFMLVDYSPPNPRVRARARARAGLCFDTLSLTVVAGFIPHRGGRVATAGAGNYRGHRTDATMEDAVTASCNCIPSCLAYKSSRAPIS